VSHEINKVNRSTSYRRLVVARPKDPPHRNMKLGPFTAKGTHATINATTIGHNGQKHGVSGQNLFQRANFLINFFGTVTFRRFT